VNYAQEQDRRDRLSQSVEQSQLAVDLSNAQYRGGQVNFLSVLEAQRDLFAAEDQLVQSQTSTTIDLITLYRALGGGWNGGRYGTMSKGNGRNASDPF
jgi:outer membrane protein TolC